MIFPTLNNIYKSRLLTETVRGYVFLVFIASFLSIFLAKANRLFILQVFKFILLFLLLYICLFIYLFTKPTYAD